LVLVNSGADHAELDAQYAAIPRQMRQIASALGGELLCQTKEEDFLSRRAELAALYGKRAANRAAHYYAETNRAAQGFAAAEEGNMREFLALSRASACSSEALLENITLDRPGGDRLKHAIDLARRAAGEEGAARVHGGGFAGTAQAWVPTARLETFICEVEAGFGAGSCLVVHPRSVGAGRIIG
ncbi:MAG: galactokinase, partial [Oscillospiraceae bacterium]|nr:galactokinase [Oscillospiraceae bacterium]